MSGLFWDNSFCYKLFIFMLNKDPGNLKICQAEAWHDSCLIEDQKQTAYKK